MHRPQILSPIIDRRGARGLVTLMRDDSISDVRSNVEVIAHQAHHRPSDVVKRPVIHSAFSIKVPLRIAVAGHNGCLLAADVFAASREEVGTVCHFRERREKVLRLRADWDDVISLTFRRFGSKDDRLSDARPFQSRGLRLPRTGMDDCQHKAMEVGRCSEGSSVNRSQLALRQDALARGLDCRSLYFQHRRVLDDLLLDTPCEEGAADACGVLFLTRPVIQFV